MTLTGWSHIRLIFELLTACRKRCNCRRRLLRAVAQHANTSAASIPLVATAVNDGRVKNGDVLAMEAIGGGLVWGATVVKFGIPS